MYPLFFFVVQVLSIHMKDLKELSAMIDGVDDGLDYPSLHREHPLYEASDAVEQAEILSRMAKDKLARQSGGRRGVKGRDSDASLSTTVESSGSPDLVASQAKSKRKQPSSASQEPLAAGGKKVKA
jgi:hypothetical protein